MNSLLCRAFLWIPLVMTASFLTMPTSSFSQQSANAAAFAKSVQIGVIISKPSKIKGGDFDDKVQVVGGRIKLTNSDVRHSFEGYSLTLSFFGQSTIDGKVRKVILQEAVSVNLAPRGSQEQECKEVTTRFDKTGAKFGFFYDGWIAVVKDTEGKVVFVKSTSPTLEKLPEQASMLALDGCYNSKLVAVGDPDRL